MVELSGNEVGQVTMSEQRAMADRIKKRRKSLGYTQEQFAEIVELSIGSYTKIENIFQKPSLDTLIKIARHLDLSLDYIIFGTGGDPSGAAADTDMLNALLKYTDSDKLLHASELLARIAKIKSKGE
jgi:transcriptional regulator with XRE-family HTH domain